MLTHKQKHLHKENLQKKIQGHLQFVGLSHQNVLKKTILKNCSHS
jgi:hypothetical protein